ncbi:MAG: hypothetical protein NVSMB66_0960 [Candidatus Doudnabacteria bacterium]
MEYKILPVPCAVITNDKGEVYMQLRNDPGSEAHNKWELPGGGMDYGETPEETILREVKEETNLDVQIVRLLPKIFTNTWTKANIQVVLISYHCTILPQSPKPKYQESEVSESKFIKPENFDFENSLKYCKEIIELLNQ